MMPKTSGGLSSRTIASARSSLHAVPRTVTEGDRALYGALYPAASRSTSSDAFARACGLPRSPIDALAAFHIVFGKTVPDISRTPSPISAMPRDGSCSRSIPATR